MLNFRKSFTLIELLVVLAIVAILSVVVVMTLNPAELIKQARDSTRLSDLSTINTALAAFNTDVTSGFMGTSSIVYVSVPDTSPTCANLGLPTLPSGWTYNCVTATSTRLVNGAGWIPVNFTSISFGNPLSSLPVDPINTTSSGNYYTYASGGSWILTALPESAKQKTALAAIPNISNYPDVIAYGTNLSLSPLYNNTGLVGYWKFDEGSGTPTSDSSGNGSGGSWNGTLGSQWGTGRVGGAGYFNGTNNYISTNLAATNSDVTYTMWAKTVTPNATYQGLMGTSDAGNGFSMLYYYYSANRVSWWNNGNFAVLSSNGRITDTNWHYIAATRTGSSGNWTMTIYIDGQFDKSQTDTNDPASSGTMVIGKARGSGLFFPGFIDEARIYNRALSAAEILALYNATK